MSGHHMTQHYGQDTIMFILTSHFNRYGLIAAKIGLKIPIGRQGFVLLHLAYDDRHLNPIGHAALRGLTSFSLKTTAAPHPLPSSFYASP